MPREATGQPWLHADPIAHLGRIRSHYSGFAGKPALIIGNGPSAADVPEEFLGRVGPLEDACILRCNWFFLEESQRFGRRVDGYAWTVSEPALEAELRRLRDTDSYAIKGWLAPMRTRLWPAGQVPEGTGSGLLLDPWILLASQPEIAAFMADRPLPTLGLQLLAFALLLGAGECHVVGLDFYEGGGRRYAHTVPDRIARALPAKDTTPGYEAAHSKVRDLEFLDLLLRLFPDRGIHAHSHSETFIRRLADRPAGEGAQEPALDAQQLGQRRLEMSRPRPDPEVGWDRFAVSDDVIQRRQLVPAENDSALPLLLARLAAEGGWTGQGAGLGEETGYGPDGEALRQLVCAPPPTRMPQAASPPASPRAFVTVADMPYAPGVEALACSLARWTKLPLIVLSTDPAMQARLAGLPGVEVRIVPAIANPNRRVKRRRFRNVYTKLHVFGLSGFDRLVYLDADTIVLGDPEPLFEGTGFSAAPDWGEEICLHRFNSGVMAFTPSQQLFEDMLGRLADVPSDDGGDQGFLNQVFPDWTRLHPAWNTLARLIVANPVMLTLDDVRILHFVGPKPWEPAVRSPVERELLQVWESVLPAGRAEVHAAARKPATPRGAIALAASWQEERFSPLVRLLAERSGNNLRAFVRDPAALVRALPGKIATAVRLLRSGLSGQ